MNTRRQVRMLRTILSIGLMGIGLWLILPIPASQAALVTCPVGVGTTPTGWTSSLGSRGGGIAATGVFNPGTNVATDCYLITDYTSPAPKDPKAPNVGDTPSTFFPITNIIPGTTNASRMTSPKFTASAGQQLDFSFMFATTDGTATFSDWARVSLIDSKGKSVIDLFTARTGDNAQVVPGFGFPTLAPGLTLTPGTASLQGNVFNLDGVRFGPFRYPEYFNTSSKLVGGSTPWVDALYTFSDTTAGTYQLEMTVANVGDQAYASALVFSGLSITNDPVVSVPEPGTLGLLVTGLVGVGAIVWRRRAL